MATENTRWCKSSYSSNGGACIEVAANVASSCGYVPVRDSKDPAGPVVAFPADSFAAFVTGVQAGDFGDV